MKKVKQLNLVVRLMYTIIKVRFGDEWVNVMRTSAMVYILLLS